MKIIKSILISLLFIPPFVFAQNQGILPSAGITPESNFYFLDKLGEALREFFTFNPEGKARLQITFAAERVAEIKVILETKGVNAKGLEVAQSRLQANIAKVAGIVDGEKSKGKDVSEFAKSVSNDFDANKKALKQVFKDQERSLEAKEDEFKAKIHEARRVGDIAQDEILAKGLGEIKAQKELLELKEEEQEEALEREEEKIEMKMDKKEDAEKAIKEAEEERQEVLDETAEEGVSVLVEAFKKFDKLLAQAKELFAKENYAGAKQLAKQAEDAFEKIEETIEDLDEAKEKEEELKEGRRRAEEKRQELKADEKRHALQIQEEAKPVQYYQKNTPTKTKSDEEHKKIRSEPQKTDTRGPSNISSPNQQFAVLEKELIEAQASGSYFSPEHSNRIQNDLTNLENQNYDAAEIKRLRAIVLKLSPHLQNQSKPNTVNTLTTTKICRTSNPILTADITDFSKIQKITAPGSPSSEGPKGHSFVGTNGQYVPVYAPIAGVFSSGSYSKDNAESPAQYMLFFEINDNCNYQFKFDHIDEPIAALKAQLPETPKVGDSRTTQATGKLEFKAGDLLGYTRGTKQAGNWDFGLYDTRKDGALAEHGSYGMHRKAVCWVDFYSSEKQALYRNLLDGPKLVCSFGGTSTSSSQNKTVSTQSSPASTGSAVENKPPGKPLVIKNLGVSFEPWNKSTNRAGGFLFLLTENKLFLEYGVEVPSSEGGTKILPTFEYRTAKDADVFAASDGIITKIVYQPQTQDYEILIQPEVNSQWTLGHDHVSNIRVSEGNNVKAGDLLGKAGTLGGALGRTEIMIWGGPSSANRPLTHCPFKLFAPELLSEYQQKVSRHMKDWEEFKGNQNLYNEEKHIFPGCVYETLLD